MNPLFFLIHQLLERTNLKSMFHLRRNQVIDLLKQKLRTILSKNTGTFLKISFFFMCFSHIFAIANQLPC